ncbi:MAG: M18 family aminopeptidase [Acidimicrobiales bacterium]|nr:M18 family aminopeptidase [Acidimicrobiales bacterium]
MERGLIDNEFVNRLLSSIEVSPTPYHCARTAAERLSDAGFVEVRRTDPVPSGGGRYVRVDGGSLIAWATPESTPDRFTVVGAHTDSPNLRIRANADQSSANWAQLGVEVYGGVLLNSWLDRDLGLAGRVSLADGEVRLFLDDRPVARVAQLAIHLDREIRDQGLKLDPQTHLTPLWAIADQGPAFVDYVAEQVGAPANEVLAWDAMVFDTNAPAVVGLNSDLIASARIDNQLSCFAATEALAEVVGSAEGSVGDGAVKVVALFDHEEVGSASATGADGASLSSTLERIAMSIGLSRSDFLEALTRSYVVSADGAHATHPNYADKHEPSHHINVNDGVVVKRNSNQRYASDAVSEAPFRAACSKAGVPVQTYIHRNDLPCGSTIGPATSAQLGVRTIDVGAPQLAMHSARETAGALDACYLKDSLAAVLEHT